MNRPESQRGGDAFDAFFGDPSGQHPEAEEEPTQEVWVGRGAAGQSEENESLPESWWAGAPGPGAVGSATSATWTSSGAPGPAVRPRRRVSAAGLVALLLGGVLLGGAGVAGAMNLLSGGGGDPTAAPSTATSTQEPTASGPSSSSSSSSSSEESSTDADEDSATTEETTESTPEETTESTTESTSSTTEESEPTSSSTTEEPSTTSTSSSSTPSSTEAETTAAERSGELPQGVSACGGEVGGVKAGSATALTSCPFATAVRDAYVSSGGGASSLRVRSPVTDRSYTMSCSGESVTTCTGGNHAVVVLY